MTRGDVILGRLPHPSGVRGKKRPAVVIQSDAYSGVVRSLVVAGVTSNLSMQADPACLLVDITTPDGRLTGLKSTSVVSCLELATVYDFLIDSTIGRLPPALVPQLDACLKVALDLR